MEDKRNLSRTDDYNVMSTSSKRTLLSTFNPSPCVSICHTLSTWISISFDVWNGVVLIRAAI